MQKHQQLDDRMNIHIITLTISTTAMKHTCPPSCDLYAPRGKTIYIYIYIKQVRFHRYPGGVFVGH